MPLIEYPHYQDFERLLIRRLAKATHTLLSEQEARIAKHYWGDNEQIMPLTPIEAHCYFYPIAVYTGSGNLPLDEMVVMYQIVRTSEGKLSFEVAFSLFGQREEKEAHANYFENVIVTLQNEQYPLVRNYEIEHQENWRIVRTHVGLYEADNFNEQEIKDLAQAILETHKDLNKIFTS